MSTEETPERPAVGSTPEAAAELADNLRSVKALGEDRVGDASAPYAADADQNDTSTDDTSTDDNGDDHE